MSIKARASNLQSQIHEKDYYISLYHQALIKHNMSIASIDQHEFSDKQLVKMFNDFWIALPDSMSIRREPFFELCDLCEEIYDLE